MASGVSPPPSASSVRRSADSPAAGAGAASASLRVSDWATSSPSWRWPCGRLGGLHGLDVVGEGVLRRARALALLGALAGGVAALLALLATISSITGVMNGGSSSDW